MKSRAQCEKVLSAAQKYEAPYLLHVVYFCKSKLTNGFLLFCALFCCKRWEHILSAQEKNLCYAVFSIARAQKMTAMLIFLIRKIAPKNDAIFAPANGGWPFPIIFHWVSRPLSSNMMCILTNNKKRFLTDLAIFFSTLFNRKST